MYVQYHVLATFPTSAFTLSWFWNLLHGLKKISENQASRFVQAGS